jgi:hypothetical protein
MTNSHKPQSEKPETNRGRETAAKTPSRDRAGASRYAQATWLKRAAGAGRQREACPFSTEGGTRRVQLVREGGGPHSALL